MLDLFVPKPWKQMYDTVSGTPEREVCEHPSEFISRVYGSSFNSQLTGLPGYSPPWPVRLINGGAYTSSYLTLLSVLFFLGMVLYSGLVWTFETMTTAEVVFQLPFTGWDVFTMESTGFTLVMTPIVLGLVVFVLSTWATYALYWLSAKVSVPYEEEYEEWLTEIEPTNKAYPAGLQYEMYGGDEVYEDLPASVPPAFRDLRLFEKVLRAIKALFLVQFSMMFQMMWMQNRVVYPKTNIEETTSKVDERQKTFMD